VAVVLTSGQDVEDFVYGLTFLATGGGGGTIAEGVEVLQRELNALGRIRIPDIDELADDVWTVTTLIISGREPDSPPSLAGIIHQADDDRCRTGLGR
jgi:hypothetical protein